MSRRAERRARYLAHREALLSDPVALEAERAAGRERGRRRRAAETAEQRAVRVAKANRRTWLKRLERLGVDEAWYLAKLTEQDGRCAGCRSDDPGFREGTMWPVDHDHKTGKPRGLLCHRCNTALGLLDDDPVRLRALVVYLERWLG